MVDKDEIERQVHARYRKLSIQQVGKISHVVSTWVD